MADAPGPKETIEWRPDREVNQKQSHRDEKFPPLRRDCLLTQESLDLPRTERQTWTEAINVRQQERVSHMDQMSSENLKWSVWGRRAKPWGRCTTMLLLLIGLQSRVVHLPIHTKYKPWWLLCPSTDPSLPGPEPHSSQAVPVNKTVKNDQ